MGPSRDGSSVGRKSGGKRNRDLTYKDITFRIEFLFGYMLDPLRVDFAIDLAYGALILIAIVLIATLDFGVGIAFGVGVFSAYVLHVIWKMARFDPEWMTAVVQDTVEETVEETVGEQLANVQQQVDAVDERVDRRPREEDVEDLIEDADEAEDSPRQA